MAADMDGMSGAEHVFRIPERRPDPPPVPQKLDEQSDDDFWRGPVERRQAKDAAQLRETPVTRHFEYPKARGVAQQQMETDPARLRPSAMHPENKVFNDAATDSVELVFTPPVSAGAVVDDDKTYIFDMKRGHAPEARAVAPFYEYVPSYTAFTNVRIEDWTVNYQLYDDFLRDVRKYFTVNINPGDGHFSSPAGELPPQNVHYFSFRPQFREMNREQLRFYFYFRGQALAGKLPQADLTYMLLLVYEIINAPELYPPQSAIATLLSLWKGYRAQYPRADRFMSDWVADYCLIHRLTLDFGAIEEILPDVWGATSFRCFYLDPAALTKHRYIPYLIDKYSEYNYKKSNFYVEEHRELFDTHIPAMLEYMFEKLGPSVFDISGESEELTVTREAYLSAVAVRSIKKRIIYKTVQFAQNARLKDLVTNAVRYSENCVRAHIKIKTRLQRVMLPEPAVAALDGYAAVRIPPPVAVKKPAHDGEIEEESAPARFADVDITAANVIERQSWKTTGKLVALQTKKPLSEAKIDGLLGDLDRVPDEPRHGHDDLSVLDGLDESPRAAGGGHPYGRRKGLDVPKQDVFEAVDAESPADAPSVVGTLADDSGDEWEWGNHPVTYGDTPPPEGNITSGFINTNSGTDIPLPGGALVVSPAGANYRGRGGSYAAFTSALRAPERELLRLIAAGNATLSQLRAACGGQMPENTAGRINELAADILGDVVVDVAAWRLIEDYADEVREGLNH